MSRISNVLVALLIMFACMPTVSYAQQDDGPNAKTAYFANPRYSHMVQQATLYRADNFRFGRLRHYYMQTRQYDPIGDETVNKMLKYAYEAQTQENEDKANEALIAYEIIVMDHLANLRVVLQALALARSDSRFGDPSFYEWAREGLIDEVMRSGDGKTLSGAYNVITIDEESMLLARLGLKVLETKSRREGAISYNMHKVENARTGRRFTVFVDTSRPMDFLEDQTLKKMTPLEMRRQ